MGTPVDELTTIASGTSMAAPHAAGAAALLKERWPRLTQRELREQLMSGCRDLHLAPNGQGRGRLDLRPLLGGPRWTRRSRTPAKRDPAARPAPLTWLRNGWRMAMTGAVIATGMLAVCGWVLAWLQGRQGDGNRGNRP